MFNKTTAVSMMVSLAVFAVSAVGVGASSCNAYNNTNVNVASINSFYGVQASKSVGITGGSLILGNIGGPIINQSGAVTNTTTQTQVANSTTNNITVTSGGATSTTNILNTGSFSKICH